MRTRTLAIRLALSSSALLGALSAHASQSVRAELEVTHAPGTTGCASAELLARSVEARLMRRVFTRDGGAAADFLVRVGFSRGGTEYRARIELYTRSGEFRGQRSLVARSRHCSSIDDSLALSIALLLDSVSAEPAPQAAARASTGEPAPRRSTRPITIPPTTLAPREPWRFAVASEARVSVGLLPGAALGVAAGVALEPPRTIGVVGEGEYWFSDEAAGERPASGARFQLMRAGLLVCAPAERGARLTARLCAGQSLGYLRSFGFGFDRNLRDERLTYGLSLRAEAHLRVAGPLGLRGVLGGEAPLVRDRFGTRGAGARELFRPSPVVLASGVGVLLGW
jgi:hypothetical protein